MSILSLHEPRAPSRQFHLRPRHHITNGEFRSNLAEYSLGNQSSITCTGNPAVRGHPWKRHRSGLGSRVSNLVTQFAKGQHIFSKSRTNSVDRCRPSGPSRAAIWAISTPSARGGAVVDQTRPRQPGTREIPRRRRLTAPKSAGRIFFRGAAQAVSRSHWSPRRRVGRRRPPTRYRLKSCVAAATKL